MDGVFQHGTSVLVGASVNTSDFIICGDQLR